jgi:histidinol phosphatase-like PHP family hydrolase
MVTVLREAGFRFVIYTDDHEPAHVHVYGDGEARINVIDLTVLSNRRMTKRDLQVALNIVQANRGLFLKEWQRIHG